MTSYQLLTTLFYLGFALFALLRTWRHEGRKQVGVVLFLCWLASNAIFWALAVHWRPQIFSVVEVLFALTAAKAGKETDSKVAIPLIVLSVMAICAHTAFSFSVAHSIQQIHTYEIALNAIFAAQCLITGFWGAADEFLRTGRFPRRVVVGRGAPELASRSTEKP